jgi:hypothetical protein
MSDLTTAILEFTKPNLKKRLFLALNYPVKPEPEIVPHVPEHLKYMAEHEDKVFLSGPFIKSGRLVDEGLMILKTDREEYALEFMYNEPLVKRGLRRFELKVWEIREGSLTVRISAATSRCSLPDYFAGSTVIRNSQNISRRQKGKAWWFAGCSECVPF